MTALQEAERLLPNLTPAEKALFSQRLVSDLGDAFPGIDARPSVHCFDTMLSLGGVGYDRYDVYRR